MKLTKTKRSTKSRLVIAAILAGVLVTGYACYAYFAHTWPFPTNYTSEVIRSENDGDTINLNPPTSQEIEDSQDAKRRAEEADSNNASATPSSTQTKNVAVGVAYADIVSDKLEIRAFTPGVVEGGGECTAKLVQGSLVITGTSVAFVDSSSSQCRPIYINVSDFPSSGKWQLIVSYSSSTSRGTSDTVEVKI